MTRYLQALFSPERSAFLVMLRHPAASMHQALKGNDKDVLKKNCGMLQVANALRTFEILNNDLGALRKAIVVQWELFAGGDSQAIFNAIQIEAGMIPDVPVHKTDHYDDYWFYHDAFEADDEPENTRRAVPRRKLLEVRGPHTPLTLIKDAENIWIDDFVKYREAHLEECNRMMWKFEGRVNRLGYSLFAPSTLLPPTMFSSRYLKGFESSYPDPSTWPAPLIDWKPEFESHRYLFIVGSHHSGTSLFKELFGRHPMISEHLDTHVDEDEGQYLQTVYNVRMVGNNTGLNLFHSTAYKPHTALTVHCGIWAVVLLRSQARSLHGRDACPRDPG